MGARVPDGLEFRLLGPVEVADPGGVLDLGGRQSRLLAALLALSPNRVVSTAEITSALWPYDAPASALRTIHSLVSRVRRVLTGGPGDPGAALLTQPPGYVLQVPPERVDAGRFDQLRRRGDDALARGDAEEASAAYAAALALWRGPALADLADAPAVSAEAARLDEARLAVTEEFAHAELVRGRPAAALGPAEALVAAQPLRERGWGLLMLALYGLGRQAEALAAYGRLRDLLDAELGVEPTPWVRDVQLHVLRQDPGLPGLATDRVTAVRPAAPGGLPLPAGLAAAGATAFVGRASELAHVASLAGDPARARTAVVWLLGEPGIGKTRLAAEIARREHARGAAVLFGRAAEGGGVEYEPFLEALRAVGDRLGSRPGELTRLLREPGAERYELFEAVRDWLATAGGGPVVLVLDDLQWAGPETLALVGHLARSAEPSRLLLVCTARSTTPDATSALLGLVDEVVRVGTPCRRLVLGGLSTEELAQLVGPYAAVRTDFRLDHLVADLEQETAGNPLFVAALLPGFGGRPADPDLADGSPAALAGAVARRVDRLPDGVGAVLRIGALIGPDFDLRVVAAAAGLPELDVVAALEDAAGAGLVAETGPDRYRFVHALVRSALRDGLSRARRVRLHQRIAEALTAHHGDRASEHANEISHHAGGGFEGLVAFEEES